MCQRNLLSSEAWKCCADNSSHVDGSLTADVALGARCAHITFRILENVDNVHVKVDR